jgi:hypothetical protein
MDMVFNPTNDDRRAIQLLGNATKIRMERLARRLVAQERPAFLGRENQMKVYRGKGLRHAETMPNPKKTAKMNMNYYAAQG